MARVIHQNFQAFPDGYWSVDVCRAKKIALYKCKIVCGLVMYVSVKEMPAVPCATFVESEIQKDDRGLQSFSRKVKSVVERIEAKNEHV